MKNHLVGSLSLELTDFQSSPFQQQGGIIKARQLFGNRFDSLFNELQEIAQS